MKIRLFLFFILFAITATSHAFLNLDRTRIIFNESGGGVSIVVENSDETGPFLAKAWIEDVNGNKDSSSLIALPILQEINPKQKKQIKVSYIKGQNKLPTDRESLFYFNVLGVPPQVDEGNHVQFTFQSRLKLFYRPIAISEKVDHRTPFQEKLSLVKNGNTLHITNPTPYHIVITDINKNNKKSDDFGEVIVPPLAYSDVILPPTIKDNLTIVYLDDFGSLHFLNYQCQSNSCSLVRG